MSGRGRGAYYKAKYGGGRKSNRIDNRNEGNCSNDINNTNFTEAWRLSSLNGTSTKNDLSTLLSQIDRQQYGAYKRLVGEYLFDERLITLLHGLVD